MTVVVVIVLSLIAFISLGGCAYLLIKGNSDSARSREEYAALQLRLEASANRVEELSMRLEQRADEQRCLALAELKNITEEALRSRSESLRDENARQMSALINPLREQIGEFRRAVSDSYLRDNATRRSLSDQIDRLMALNLSISKEASELSSALKGNTKVQGEWGELMLEGLLEKAGLVKDVNFRVQPTTDAQGKQLRDPDSGRSLRPDVVVNLPEEKCIVIDSKVSLTAYMEWHEADSPEKQDKAGKRHLESVRRHIDELASKRYHRLFPGAVDHVLMFIPNEGAWNLAFSLDDNLWKYAFDRKISIVSPTHLFTVLHLVSQLWRQERQNRNVEEVARLGGLLYDGFVKFANDFSAIETAIERASKAYGECRKGLVGGSRSLAARAERLRDLGVRTNRRLPEDLLPESNDLGE